MRITHVTAYNWRNFKRLDFPIDNRLFVVGPNASGKSNLLDLFRFLGDVAGTGGGLSAAIERRGGISKVRSLFARNNQGGRLILDLRLGDGEDTWRYRLAIRGERGTRQIVDEERVERNGAVILDRPDSDDFRDRERLIQTHLEQVVVNREFRRLSDYFAGVQYVHPASHMFGDSGWTTVAPSVLYGADVLARFNAVPDVIRRARIDRIATALRSAPDLRSLRRGVEAADRQDEADLPEGALRLVGLLWPVVSAPADDGVLLLDEPARSLNSAIVRTLPTVLASARRDRSSPLIAATQRLEMLDDEGVRPEEVLVLRATRDGTTADVLADIGEVEEELRARLPISGIVGALIAPPDLAGLMAVGQRRRR